MEVIALNFTKTDNLYVSDIITSTGGDIVVYIRLKEVGNVRIERSINGVNFTVHEILEFDEKEIQIIRAIEGQNLRFVSKKPVTLSFYKA